MSPKLDVKTSIYLIKIQRKTLIWSQSLKKFQALPNPKTRKPRLSSILRLRIRTGALAR